MRAGLPQHEAQKVSNGGRSAYDQPEAPSMTNESSVQGVVFKYQ